MRGATVFRGVVTAAVGIVPFVWAQEEPEGAQPMWLDAYRCESGECGALSQYCWGVNHPWGGTTCAYCTGGNEETMCRKAEMEKRCYYLDTNRSCGERMVGGSCAGGPVGTCSGGFDYGECSVPLCAPGPGQT